MFRAFTQNGYSVILHIIFVLFCIHHGSAWEMMDFRGVNIKRLAAGLPEHFAALAEDPALTKRLEIEGINSMWPTACMFSKLGMCWCNCHSPLIMSQTSSQTIDNSTLSIQWLILLCLYCCFHKCSWQIIITSVFHCMDKDKTFCVAKLMEHGYIGY